MGTVILRFVFDEREQGILRAAEIERQESRDALISPLPKEQQHRGLHGTGSPRPHVFSFLWVSLGMQVPDCFLEVASLTLQEFFRAVSTGKDSDPSWKKPIYKIISKLDSDIPEIFKSSNYPQELFRN